MATNFSSLMSGPSGNNLMIVDSMNLAFRWKHQGRLEFKEEYLRTVESLAKSYDCSKVLIAADFGSSTYRKAMYPEYKQNRKDKADQQTPEGRNRGHLDGIKKRVEVEALAQQHLIVIEVESDDQTARLLHPLE